MKNIVAANWKMNLDIKEAENTARNMAQDITADSIDIVVCPAFIHLDRIFKVFSSSVIKLGAQNMYFEEKGAFTGEVSPLMLKSVGCEYVIIGHSERRHIFNESNELINKKVKSALSQGLIPIVCVGETLEERNSAKAFDIVKTQLNESLKNIDLKKIVVAYEPVWAIGTGVSADKDTIEKMHSFIRSFSEDFPILYGGSVKPKNSAELASIENVNGFLVGGASLIPDDFKEIIDKFKKTKGVV